MKELYDSFMRYALAGGMGFIIDYVIFALSYKIVNLHYLTSSMLGFLSGVIFVYILSNKWVFTSRRMAGYEVLEFLIFAFIGIVGMGMTLLFMWLFVDVCCIYPLISKLITTMIVLLWNFGARKLILYS